MQRVISISKGEMEAIKKLLKAYEDEDVSGIEVEEQLALCITVLEKILHS